MSWTCLQFCTRYLTNWLPSDILATLRSLLLLDKSHYMICEWNKLKLCFLFAHCGPYKRWQAPIKLLRGEGKLVTCLCNCFAMDLLSSFPLFDTPQTIEGGASYICFLEALRCVKMIDFHVEFEWRRGGGDLVVSGWGWGGRESPAEECWCSYLYWASQGSYQMPLCLTHFCWWRLTWDVANWVRGRADLFRQIICLYIQI